MRKRWILLAAVTVMITACTSPQQKKVNTLKEEVIALHDEVMPRMGELSELSAEIKSMRDAVKTDTSANAQASTQTMTMQIKALEDAHEAMMEWMAEYEPMYDQEHHVDSAVAYYTQQKQEIGSVKKTMEKSIEDAKRYLGKGE